MISSAEESQRADVAVFLVTFLTHQFRQGIHQLIFGIRQFHAHQFRGLPEPLEVVLRAEDEQLLLFFSPVGPQPSKHGRTVVQRMSENSNIRVFIRNDAAFEECVVR